MFDAQVVLSPKNSPRGQLLAQYVAVRITRMDDVDIALFDYDRNNTLYYFAMNADEQIYLRYGGRDSASPDTYLHLDSIEAALRRGLELHKKYQAGEIPKAKRPDPLSPRQFPLLVERTYARNNCVECHLIGDFQNMHRELDGTLDKPRHLYRSPDIKTIGIHLDVPRGLVVKEAQGAVEAAGMKSGDLITAVDGTAVWTFADLQHRYDQVPRDAQRVKLTVERGGAPAELSVALPPLWWVSDVRWRQSSIEPRVYFDGTPVDAARKQHLKLDPDGFATEVKSVDMFAEVMKSHQLKRGDIITAVNGVSKDPVARTADLYIRLRVKAGDTVALSVLRDGKPIAMGLKTFRMSFRK
ncbi:MAG: PDZ domain-containing protein [Acidobacteria bacterium]|nr:PDZ domain-containing protein [Acidobacteriota bacterium]